MIKEAIIAEIKVVLYVGLGSMPNFVNENLRCVKNFRPYEVVRYSSGLVLEWFGTRVVRYSSG